ncbi:hypothetical protein O181_048500 [Austropuccinia psidii MF-1]|uniref:Integrase catalytic domain-containing protein n=1 Tax=Austropuccinia psidii MF-1 TaxID=1389203 RepID=A0A9Q3DS14_9BASI|nr:hypothetical protein [Austropuccinia psidii MF-1]
MILTKLQDYVHLTKDNNPPLPSNSATALVSTSNEAYKVIYYCTNGKHNNKSTSHTKNKCWAENPHLKPTCKDNKQRKVEANSYLTKALITSLTTVPEDKLILDCGATHHMFNSPKFFHSLSDSTNIPVTTGNTNSTLKAIGVRKDSLLCSSQPLELDDCLYVPNLKCNLISLLALFKNKLISNFSNNMFTIESNNSTLLSGRRINQLMHLNHTLPKAHLTLTNNNLWHQRLGHPGMAVLKKLGLATSDTICTVCELNKAHKQPFNEKFEDSLSPLDCVHIDLVGPIHPPSISRSQYFLSITNQATLYKITKFLERKSEAFEEFLMAKTFLENQKDQKLKKLVSDQGGEFLRKKFELLARAHGFIHRFSSPETPQHNGFTERSNRTILDKARSITKNATFDKTSFPSINQDCSLANATANQQHFTIGKINPTAGEPHKLVNQGPPAEMADEPHAEEDFSTKMRTEAPQVTRIRVIVPRHPTLVNSDIDNLNILPYSRRANILLTS